MKPHKPGQSDVKLRKSTTSRHPAKVKAKPAPRKRAHQADQFTGTKQATLAARKSEIKTNGFRVTETMLARARGKKRESLTLAKAVFASAKPMPGVVPEGKETMAMDEQIEVAIGWAAQSIYNGAFEQGVTFLGYPYLAELAQRAEYRRICEVIATEMTREWIEIKAHEPDEEDLAEPGDEDGEDLDDGLEDGDAESDSDAPAEMAQDFAPPKPGDEAGGMPFGNKPPDPKPVANPEAKKKLAAKQKAMQAKQERVKELEEEFKRLNVQACFKEIAEQDGFFGRAHLFIDVAAPDDILSDSAMGDPNELKIPIGTGEPDDLITKAKVPKGSVKRLKTVEAIWNYPANYNSSNPLRRDWYKPTMWFVQGMEVHGSRLLTFVGREVPDMLKPAYSFGGLALTQMAQPTVLNWLRTRQSVSDIVHAFSVFVLKTNMQTSIQDDGQELFQRADFFNLVRDNRGLMMIDKDSEEFENVSAPISGLDKLQAQSQEHICLTGDTLIETARGQVPISLVVKGDRVMTRRGFAPVIWAGQTAVARSLVTVQYGETSLRMTPCHPIYCPDLKQFVPAQNVKATQRLLSSRAWVNTDGQSHGAVAFGPQPSKAITAMFMPAASFIEFCGKRIVAQFQRAMMFITKMKIPMITAFATLSSSPMGNTSASMCFLGETASTYSQSNTEFAASSVKSSLKRFGQSARSIAAEIVSKLRTERISVKSSLVQTANEPVYNLTVADGYLPEFFANGVLVHNCSVTGLPLVKYTGVSPSGLNATSEFELQCFYEWIRAYQIAFFQPNLTRIFHFAQINLWGKVDPDLYFEFRKLKQLTGKEQAELEKADADRDKALIDASVLNPEEVRARLSKDSDGPYAGISIEDGPEMGENEDQINPFDDKGDDDETPNKSNGAVSEPEA